MITTVVGSYPVVFKENEDFFDKIKKIFGIYDPYKYAIEVAVKDQINAGIDIISDGQVRGDMVEIFTSKLFGFEDRRVVNRVEFVEPITLKDILYAKKIAKKLNSNVEVKGIITGPNTIAYSVKDEYYSNKEELIFDIAKALRNEVLAIKNHVSYIQIDEPILSVGIADFEVAKRAIDIIVRGINKSFGMHVCGKVYNIIDELNEFNVSILDHEFASNRKNLEILDRIKKKVGFGCVNTKVNKVESVEEIKGLIKEGLEIIKNNNFISEKIY
ncbi:methionine synthase [Methanocaldococcus villosus KIN24-T80]|uniref:Methionine synthase n=1 Tax=Methanocaldococcus villosus KIN24-T80 TaxID=1069083 RepID=N6VTN0_9EURY|nr:methionine synthase [Methanocaldococcus villosus KIN24-T80]